MPVKWIATDKHVYGSIYREHYDELKVFGTCSAPEGSPQLGLMNPYMLTEWGFNDSDEPIIKSIGRKKSLNQKNYDYEYFIAIIINEEAS